MRANAINNTSFGNIKVLYKDNPHKKYLTNEMLDLFRKNIGNIGGKFANDFVEINGESKDIIKQLNSKNIFYRIVNGDK